MRVGGELGRRIAGDQVAGDADLAGREDRPRLAAGLGARLVERRQFGVGENVDRRAGDPAVVAGVDDVDAGIGEAGAVLDAVFLEGEGAAVGGEAEEFAVGVVAGQRRAAGQCGDDEGAGEGCSLHGYTMTLSAARLSAAMLSL